METSRYSEVRTDMSTLTGYITISIMISMLFFSIAAGQEQDTTTMPDSADSAISADSLVSDAVLFSGDVEHRSMLHERRSPTGALLRSLAVPGWGQFYNRKYIKALVVAVGETYCIVQAVRYWDLADQAWSRYTSDDSYNYLYYGDYDFYQDRRNLFLWLSGLAIFLSIVDAYVDAHLAGFDVDITPPFEEPDNNAVSLRLTYRF